MDLSIWKHDYGRKYRMQSSDEYSAELSKQQTETA